MSEVWTWEENKRRPKGDCQLSQLNDAQKEMVESMMDIIGAKAQVEREMEHYGFSKERTLRWTQLNDSLDRIRLELKATLH